MTSPVLGKKAPDFSLPGTSNQMINLADFKGKNVVLYFYPKDNTSGCTKEAQSFRDHLPQFEKLDTIILGVSRDSVKSHEKFRDNHQLPFTLISDENEMLCNLYNVIKMKNMYGKQVRGIERSTFLIDKNGILQREWRKVKVDNHVPEILKAIPEISHTSHPERSEGSPSSAGGLDGDSSLRSG